MSSGFITETELDEARKRRQEEWEKVRQPDQPLERPEEPQDNRSLFERLKEQKMKKDMEYEEAHKLKNLIRGLDDDEVDFLEFVDRNKMKAEKQQKIEEQKELAEFRQSVASLKEKSEENRILLETSISKTKPKLSNHGLIGSGSSKLSSQKSILKSGIVIRKRKNGEIENSNNTENDNDSTITAVILPKKQKYEDKQNNEEPQNQDESMNTKQKEQHKENDIDHTTKSAESKVFNGNGDSIISGTNKNENYSKKLSQAAENVLTETELNLSSSPQPPVLFGSLDRGALKCIGILPGIGKYDDTSDSEISTDSEEEVELPCSLTDLVANVMQHKKNCQDDDE